MATVIYDGVAYPVKGTAKNVAESIDNAGGWFSVDDSANVQVLLHVGDSTPIVIKD